MSNLYIIEKRYNIKLPLLYKQEYMCNFNNLNKNLVLSKNEKFFLKFLDVENILDILNDNFDLFGYDIIPFAKTEYDDYICFFYEDTRYNPKIIFFAYDLSIINKEEAIFYLYNSFNEFVLNQNLRA